MSVECSDDAKVPFEVAIDRAGFGLYSFMYTALTGLVVMSFGFVAYGSTIIVPISACELETTSGQQGALAAAPVIGLLIGAMMWGYLGDTRGRRNMLLVSLLSASAVNCLASISVNWVMLLILQLIATILASGQYSLSMTLLSESVPSSKRNIVVLLVTSIFLLSQGIMAVVALPIVPLSFSHHLPALGIYWNSWRTVVVVYCIPSLIAAVWLFFMQESPKFALAKGQELRALEILRVIHRVNNRKAREEFQIKGLLSEEKKEQKPSSIKDQIVPLFKAPLLKYTIIMTLLFTFQQVGAFLVWLPTVANQFMQMLDSGAPLNLTLCQLLDASDEAAPGPDAVPCSLNENAMIIVLGVGALQSLVNIGISTVVNKVGRRNMAMLMTAICGFSGILVNLVPNTIGSAALYIILLIGFIVVGLYTAITVALFPTYLRALAMSLTMTGGRVGSFASIQILNFLLSRNCDAGFYIFAALFASSAIVASFLPDDRRLQTPQPVNTPEEGEHRIIKENS